MVILSKPDGGVVRLSDVATVEIGGQNYNNASFASGVPAIFVSLYPSPEGNPLEIVKQAKALVPKIREMAPPGLSVMLTTTWRSSSTPRSRKSGKRWSRPW